MRSPKSPSLYGCILYEVNMTIKIANTIPININCLILRILLIYWVAVSIILAW